MATLSCAPYRRRTSEPSCNNQSEVSIQVDVDSQSEVSIQVDSQSETSITSPVLSLTLRKLSAVADSRLWRLLELLIRDPTVSMLRSAPDTRPVSPPGQLLTYSTVQYSTVQYSTVQYSTVQYSTVQYST